MNVLNDINSRFKELRKKCNKSQEDFGKILGLTKSGVSDIERGKRNVTDQHLIMLSNWKDKPVNIEWLKTGEGEMFIPLDRQDQIAEFATGLFKGEKDSFKERLILALAGLEENEWELLEKIAEKIAKEKD